MATHMKTTIDIAPALLEEAKRIARERETTLRALVEDGLRRVLDEERSGRRYAYDHVSVDDWPKPGVDLSDWGAIKALIREPEFLDRD